MTDTKTVLVTGAAKRLGRVIVLALAEAGWDIALHYHGSHDEAEDTAREVRGKGVKVALLSADFAEEQQTAGLIGKAAAELGPLTALINSASLFENDDWQSATRQSWDLHMETNLRAPFLLSQLFARQLPEGAKGNIVNIVDQRVLKPTPQFLSYSLSKAGLYWLTTTLAQALAPNIRVNAVGPGPTIRNARQSEADFARQTQATVLGHGAQPEEVAAAVLYLLSAGSVTGQMIAVDGGQHLIWQTADVTVKE
jgi:NAD(P)-dependent dehydrogenase (short-subunit alcohol dehydrogenase family)